MKTPLIYIQTIIETKTLLALSYLIKDINKAHFTHNAKKVLLDTIRDRLQYVN